MLPSQGRKDVGLVVQMLRVGGQRKRLMLPNKKHQLKLMDQKDQNQPDTGIGNKKVAALIFRQVHIKRVDNCIKPKSEFIDEAWR